MVITYLHQGWIRINTVQCQYSDIHFLLHFHKAHPMCPGSLARLVPEQRTYSYYLQYSADRNTGFVPLEYQHSIYVQYTHALIKALLYIVLPLNLRSVPYFCAIYAPSLELSKCGGSKTTSLNERSGYGIAVKSATTSGWTSSLRPSHRMYSASRISWKRTFGCVLSNQNILLPQQASNIIFFSSILNLVTGLSNNLLL